MHNYKMDLHINISLPCDIVFVYAVIFWSLGMTSADCVL